MRNRIIKILPFIMSVFLLFVFNIYPVNAIQTKTSMTISIQNEPENKPNLPIYDFGPNEKQEVKDKSEEISKIIESNKGTLPVTGKESYVAQCCGILILIGIFLQTYREEVRNEYS